LRRVDNSTYLQDPTIAATGETGIKAAAAIKCFTPTGERGATPLQMEEALLVFGIDNAGTPDGPTTCKGNQVSEQNEDMSTERDDIQTPNSEKQSSKPWLQSRWPSPPISRFKAFLLPPAAMGAVPYSF
jgi:hypothetical protein